MNERKKNEKKHTHRERKREQDTKQINCQANNFIKCANETQQKNEKYSKKLTMNWKRTFYKCPYVYVYAIQCCCRCCRV